MKKILVFSLGGLLLVLVSWVLFGGTAASLFPEFSEDQAINQQGGFTGMGNPAAVYCKELGYEFNIIQEAKGDRGVCILPEDQECDAWDFLEGKCGQEYSYCAQQGLDMVLIHDGKNGLAQSYAVCVDENQVEVGVAVEMMDLQQKSLGCGVDMGNTNLPDASGVESATPLDFAPPASFDWTDYGGDWLTPVRNQASCGSCWAFAAVGVAESVINIGLDNPDYDINLSEQYLVTDCQAIGSYQNCCGGYKNQALYYIRDQGIPDEGCLGYVDGTSGYDGTSCTCSVPPTCDTGCTNNSDGDCSDLACSDRCSDWSARLENITQVGFVGSDQTTIKQYLIDYGPLAVSMRVESNLYSWAPAVNYSCAGTGTNHGVVIVGYNDTGGYWIVRNSWGIGFGDSGYFRVGYGECQIESSVFFASANKAPNIPSSPSPVDGVGDVSTNAGLSWTGGDPNPGDTVTYDVYFEAGNPTPGILLCDDAASESCDPGTLLEDTTYYWQVVASDQYAESTIGTVWFFTTATDDTVGVYNPVTSRFYLKNSHEGGSADITFSYGAAGAGWEPIAGDWDNDGIDTVGVYNPATGRFYLKNSHTGGSADITFVYGAAGAGWLPVTGDWNNDGVDTVGVYNPATGRFYLKNSHTGGPADITFVYGAAGAGWLPVTGDWDNDGIDTVGVYDPSASRFYLKNSHAGGSADITFVYGAAGAGWKPMTGDWDNDGIDTVGVYNPVTSRFYLKNSHAGGSADITFIYGAAGAGWIPITGDWDNQ